MTSFLTLACATLICAQDLSLATILLDDQPWTARRDLPMKGPARQVKGPDGSTYAIVGEGAKRSLEHRPAQGAPVSISVVGLVTPSCLALSPDRGTLAVGDAGGKHIWFFRVNANGTLDAADRCATLRLRPGVLASNVVDVAYDSGGRIFAALPGEIHAFDPIARACGVIASPSAAPIDSFQTNGDLLMVRQGSSVMVRMIQPYPKPKS
jgi:sugar lactone lactonase YvrE